MQTVNISLRVPEGEFRSGCDLEGFTWKYSIPCLSSLIIYLLLCPFSLIFNLLFLYFWPLPTLSCYHTLFLFLPLVPGGRITTTIHAMKYKNVLPDHNGHVISLMQSMPLWKWTGEEGNKRKHECGLGEKQWNLQGVEIQTGQKGEKASGWWDGWMKEESQTESKSECWMGERCQQLNMLTTDTKQGDLTELFW